MTRHINDEGLKLLKSFERCELVAYRDGGGIWTIGWGATGKDIYPGTYWTQKMADDRLQQDLDVFERGIENLVHVPLTDNEFSALVVFVYNIGLGHFEHSPIPSLINSGHKADAPKHMILWDKDRLGRVEKGLLRRREAEIALFNKSDAVMV